MSSVAVIFPGQGCQRPGMARDFYETFASSREVFDEASDALALDVAALCFGDGDPRLDRTEYTQPAILTAEIAMLRALERDFGLSPERWGGHSLGEYTALCAAGVIPLAIAVRLVRYRGALMQLAVPEGQGAMIAVIAEGIAERGLSAELDGLEVDVANRNSPDQIVLSGARADIARAAERIAQVGVEVRALNVSAPFHSRKMGVIEAAFRAELEQVARACAFQRAGTVTSNLMGGFHVPEERAVIDALTRQISGTVDFIANMHTLARDVEVICEIGPGRPLRSFFKAVGRDIRSVVSVRSAAWTTEAA